MAQQIINTGNTANDGTGESLRNAFTAVNENFSEIYAAGPVDSNVVISGNTINVTGINNNLVLAANGVGNIQANSTIVPSMDAVYDIGTANVRFDTVYSTYFVGNGSLLTGIAGGGGTSIINGNSNVSVAANSNVSISVGGVSNIAVFTPANIVVKANIIPTANVTYNLGSPTAAFNDLYLSNNSLFLGNASISANSTSIVFVNESGQTSVISGAGTFTPYGNANVAANLAVFGSNPISTSGNITGGNVLGGANVNATTFTGTTVSVSANVTGGNLQATGNIYIGNTVFTRTLTVGTRTTPVTVPLASNNTFNVGLRGGGNVAVYTT